MYYINDQCWRKTSSLTLAVFSLSACVCAQLVQHLQTTTTSTARSTTPPNDRPTIPTTARSTTPTNYRSKAPSTDIFTTSTDKSTTLSNDISTATRTDSSTASGNDSNISNSIDEINVSKSSEEYYNSSVASLQEMKKPNSVENLIDTHSDNMSGNTSEMTNAVKVELVGEKFMVCMKDTCRDRCVGRDLDNADIVQSPREKRSQKDLNNFIISSIDINHTAMEQRDNNANIRDENVEEYSYNSNPPSQEALRVTNSMEDAVSLNSQEQAETEWGGYSISSKKKSRNPRDVAEAAAGNSYTEVTTCPLCFCDELCVLYGDCCPDVFETCFRLTDADDVFSFITNMRGLPSGTLFTGHDWTALDIERNKNIAELATCEKVSGVEMILIGRCPSANHDTAVGEKCENSLLQLPPVSVSFPVGNVTFRNVFCAQCHGIADKDMAAWSSRLTCEPNVTTLSKQGLTLSMLSELINIGRCSISFSPPGNACSIRQCDSNLTLDKKLVQQLALDNLKQNCSTADFLLCQSYRYATNGYRNIHCMKCLNSENWMTMDKSEDVTCNSLCGRGENFGQTSNGGILIILDITGAYSDGYGRSTTSYICQDCEVFDPLTYTCTTLVCPPWHEPYRGICVESSQAHLFEGRSQLFPQEWNSLIFRLTTGLEEGRLCEFSITLFNSTTFIDQTNEDILLHKDNDSSHDEDCLIFRRTAANQVEDSVKKLLTQTLKSAVNVVGELIELTKQIPAFNLEGKLYEMVVSNRMNSTWPTCPNNSPPNLIDHFTIAKNYSTDIVLVNLSGYEVYFPYRNIGFEISLNYLSGKEKNFTINQTVAVCDINLLFFGTNCSIIKYLLNQIFQNESGLTVLASHRHYNIGDFQVRGDVVFVCSDFKHVTGNNERDLPYIIVSWIFTLMSTIFLLLMLVLYWLLPELRTLPGKMTASLAATMMLTFVSSSVSMHDLHHEYVCPVVAALSHVVTLAHFGWMSAISVNMALTFGPFANTLVRSQKDNRIFRRYCLVVWGMSLVLVMTSVVLDLTHADPPVSSDNLATSTPSSQYPRYGYPFCTWFSGPLWTRMAFIIIPYIITFVISLIGFILTLIGIQQASKNTEKLSKNTSEKARCFIYIKLSSAMGFSWVLSVVMSIYPEKEVLPYIYVCLVLLQGVLLFLSFMANQRVYSLLLKRFKTSSGLLSRSGSTQESAITSKSL